MSGHATVADAAKLMASGDVGDVLVERDGKLCGIVTDRDIVVRAIAEGKDPKRTQLGQIFSAELIALSPVHSVSDAVRIMQERALRRLPVVDQGRTVGIVSLGDLALTRDPDSALGRISSASPNT